MAFQHYSQFWTYEKNAHLKFGKPHFLAISNIISFFLIIPYHPCWLLKSPRMGKPQVQMPQTAPKNCSNLTTTSPNLVPTWLAMGTLLILGKSSRSRHPYVYIYGKIIELDDLDGGFSSHVWFLEGGYKWGTYSEVAWLCKAYCISSKH